MGIVFRQSIKGSLVIFGGVVLGALFTYLTSIILPKAELGGLRNLLGQGTVIQVFLLAGGANLVNPYMLRYKSGDAKKSVLATITLIVPIALALLAAAPYLLMKDFIVSRYQVGDRPFIHDYYTWILPLSVFLSYMTLLEYYLSSQAKVAAAIFMREVLLRVLFLALIGLYAAQFISLHLFIIGSVLIHAAPLAMLLRLAFKTEGFRINTDWSVFTKAEYRDILKYAWYHLLTTATLNLIGFVDILMLGPLSPNGLADVAIYANAQFFINVMYAPYRAMTSAAAPKLSQAFLNEEHEKVRDLFTRAGLNMLIATAGMWVLIASNLHNAVAVLKGYAAITPIVLILSIGRIVDIATGLNTELIAVSEHYKFNFRLSIFLLVIIIACERYAIPKWGIVGAAWMATLCLTVANVIKAVFLYRKKGLHPFSSNTLLILVCGAIAYCGTFLLPRIPNPFLDTLYRSTVLLLLYGCLILLLRPSPDLTHYLRQVRKDKRLF